MSFSQDREARLCLPFLMFWSAAQETVECIFQTGRTGHGCFQGQGGFPGERRICRLRLNAAVVQEGSAFAQRGQRNRQSAFLIQAPGEGHGRFSGAADKAHGGKAGQNILQPEVKARFL